MNDGAPIVVSAPARAGVLGNPSDMYGGTVIACALARRAYVAVEPWDGLRLTAHDAGLSVEVRTPNDLRLVKPPSALEAVHLGFAALAEARRSTYLNVLTAVVAHQRLEGARLHLHCWSEIPPNAGLSSSSALLVAALRATDLYLGRRPTPHRFAETARDIEYARMGVTCGFQDFYATTFGGLQYLDFRDKQDWRGPSEDPFGTVESLDIGRTSLPFVLAHTGRPRDSGETHRPLRARWLDGDAAVVRAVEEIGRLARAGKRCLLDGDWDAVAELMQRNQALIAGVGGSGPVNDALVATALRLGAHAAKLAGAGQGGTIIALHDEPAEFADRLVAAGAAQAFALSEPAPGVRREPLDLLALKLAEPPNPAAAPRRPSARAART